MTNTTLFRFLVVLFTLCGLVTRSWAEPCSVLRDDKLPCDLDAGQSAPYEGVLMTDSTAHSLIDTIYLAQKLEVQLAAEARERRADNAMNSDIIHKLKIKIEDAPLPFYESPWFWMGIIGAFGGGLALGLSLK